MSETPQILLAHHLKALKLPSFLREYEKLARQCAADRVDHVRYLQRLPETTGITYLRQQHKPLLSSLVFPGTAFVSIPNCTRKAPRMKPVGPFLVFL